MRIVVLVKQVPDIRAGAVATNPDGTIDRSSAAAIVNPADLHAIEAALRLGDDVWAISMGPKSAESSLRDTIALGADQAVLLTDRLFAGSDTWATSNALAAAIEHIGGCDIVLCGVSALDGETGHIGPQVAQRLGIPATTTCEDLRIEEGRLIARRIVEGGYEVVSLSLPALATVAETGFDVRYPTLIGRKRGRSADIATLSASELGLDAARVGLRASPTKVAHMEMIPLPNTECRFVGPDLSYEDLAAEIMSLKSDLIRREAVEARRPTRARGMDETPLIWVVCETDLEGLSTVSTQILSKSVELAETLDTGIAALLIGSDVEAAAEEASEFGADVVMTAEDPSLAVYRGPPEARIIADATARARPEMMLFGATTTGRSLAPRVAGILDTGIAADCTDLYIGDWERRGHTYRNLLHQIRPAMAGGVLATCLCPEARPQVATVRPGVFPATPNPKARRREELPFKPELEDEAIRVLERRLQQAEVGLADAHVVIAGGAGCSSEHWHLIEELAGELEGRVAASRAAVEAGRAPRSIQVGQTGTTVRPQLYIACGISGALQHVVGMKGARTIVAVNRDDDAPIFQFAHYGVIGDVADVLPKLSGAIAGARRN